MSTNSWWRDVFEELKRRRVFRVATLYIIAFWPIIQIVDILSPAIGLPDTIMRYLVFAFVAGFPIVLLLAWIFDINRGGVIEVTAEGGPDNAQPLVGGKTELTVVGVLLLLVVGLFMVQMKMEDPVVSGQEPLQLLARTQYSVAVLPFTTFNENKDEQQFADGLTEELLNVLTKVKALRVAARTSSFAYKGVNKNATEIGKELDVSIILEGSVRRNDVDDTIRVTAQLIEVKTGFHFFSHTYDRKFTDIFKIQDDIAASVVKELKITLLGDEKDKILSRSSASPEAMIAYGLAQAELARRTELSLIDAARFFNKAIELDPNYSDAFAGLANAYTLQVNYEYVPEEEYLSLAQEALDEAFRLDPESGVAWASQGLIYSMQMETEQAIAALVKAMEYNPSYAMAFMWYASLQDSQDEKLNWYQQAYALDPKSPVIGYNVASIQLEQGRDIEAMDTFAKIVEADPFYPGAYDLFARINEKRGRLDEAINQYTRAYELQPNPAYASSIARLYTDLGNFDATQKWIAVAATNLPERYLTRIDWLRIWSLVSAGRIDEAEPLLRKKVARIRDENADAQDHADAAVAAYFLDDHAAVIAAYSKLENFDGNDMHMIKSGFTDSMLAAAFAYEMEGNEVKKGELLAKLATRLDKEGAGGNIKAEHWYQRALVASLKGDRQMVLVHLQRAIDEGWRQHWRPGIEPILQGLQADASFQAMMAGLQIRMDIMREQLILASTFKSDWPG